MKKQILTLTIILATLVSGYGQAATQKVKIETIEYKKEISEQKFFETFVKEIEVIPLETKKESLIDKNPRFEMYNDCFYIYTSFMGISKILKFDSKGKFITNIGSAGKGPDEYTHFGNISVDKSGVMVLSSINNKLLYRYSHDGKFLNKKQLERMPLQIFGYKGGYLESYGFNYDKGRIIYTDSIGKSGRTLLNERKFFQSIEGIKTFTSSCKDYVIYNECFSDTVYRITGFEAKPAYVFDMKEFSTSPEFYKIRNNNMENLESIRNSVFSTIYYFHENQKYIISANAIFNKGNSSFHCMIKDKSKNIDEWIKYSDRDFAKTLLLALQLTENNEIYTIVQPQALLSLPESILKLVKNKDSVKTIKEDDNHLILKIKLK